MPNIGPLEIVVLLLILLVIFGPKRIPELGRSVGQGMRNFKQSVTGRDRGDEDRGLEARTGSAQSGPAAGTDARAGEPTPTAEPTAPAERAHPAEPTGDPRP